MSQETQTGNATATTTGLADWQAGVVAGLIGGAVMGIIVSIQNPKVIKGAIAGLLTFQGNGVAGWVIHLADSSIFGVVFAAVMGLTMLRRYNDRPTASAAIGLVFGFLLWLIAAGLVFPVWLDAVGFPNPPAGHVPNWTLPGTLLPHLVYGVLLGAIYPYLRGGR